MRSASDLLTISTILILCVVASPGQRLLVSTNPSPGSAIEDFDPCSGASLSAGPFSTYPAGGAFGFRGLRSGPDGDIYVAHSSEGSVLRFDGTTGVLIGAFVAPGAGGLSSPWALAFGPDGHLYVTRASGQTNPSVLKFDGTSGAPLGTAATVPSTALPDAARGLAFAPSGTLFVSTHGGMVSEFDVLSGILVASHSVPAPARAGGICFTPEGDLLVASVNTDNVRRLHLPSGTWSMFIPAGAGGLDAPQDLAFAPNGNLVVTSSVNGRVLEYAGRTGAYIGDFAPPGVAGSPIGLDFDLPLGATIFGRSTSASTSPPCIGATAGAVPGSANFGITCADAPPLSTGALGISPAALSAPVTLSGIDVWIDLSTAVGLVVSSDCSGFSSPSFPIPPIPGIIGAVAHAQFAWPEAAAPGGLAASRAMTIRVVAPPPACSSDPGEPNGSCGLASPLVPGGTVSGVICPAGDEDWYVFILSAPASVTASLTPPSGQNHDMELRSDCSSSALASSTNPGSQPETITRCLGAGSFRLQVRGAPGSFHATAPYTLTLSTDTGPAPVTTTSPAPVHLSSSGWHPFLHTTGFQIPGPCSEGVTVTVEADFSLGGPFNCSAFATAEVVMGASPGYSPITLATTSFLLPSPHITLSGTFTAQPGTSYEFGLRLSGVTSLCMVSIPPASGAASMIVSRSML